MSSPSKPNDPQCLAHLYKDNINWLQKWLHVRLACSHQAADLAQETFVRLLIGSNVSQRVASIREPRSYLATIAKRVMIDHYRRKEIEQAYLALLAEQPESEMISAEESCLIIETLVRLDLMLDGLGKKVKTAFLLSQLQGWTYKQIASELDVTESSVKKYMAKATQQCLIFLAEESF
jgi:RNA polymerase sigma factor (sigma-70 family)